MSAKLQKLTGYTKPDRGLVLFFTGYGKGKTTAAMGTALRAAGYGWNVSIVQFIKGEWESGEYNAALGWNKFSAGKAVPSVTLSQTKGDVMVRQAHHDKKLPVRLGRIDFVQTGRGFVKILGDKKPLDVHRQAAKRGLRLLAQNLRSKKYQLVIADELVTAVEEKLLSQNDVVKLIKGKSKRVHFLLTGHKRFPRIEALCDTVTEMKKLKHPFEKKILAVKGVDY